MKTKNEYKKQCNEYCVKTLGFECFEDDDDPYELEECFEDYWKDVDPIDFVHKVFEEDFANLEYNCHLEEESRMRKYLDNEE